MVRYAEWKREPYGACVWTLRAIVEDAPWVALTTTGMIVLVAGVALFFVLGFLPGLGEIWSFPTLPTFRRRAPASLAALAPAWGGGFPVRVRLSARGMRTGFDEAVVAFVDGWLCVEGLRTSFSFRACDHYGVFSGESYVLYLPNGQQVEFQPYDRGGSRRGLVSDFAIAFRRWRTEDTPDGIPVLPPQTVHPWAWGKVGSNAAWGGILVILALLALPIGGLLAWAVAAIVASCGIWRLGLGVRDLTRLASLPT